MSAEHTPTPWTYFAVGHHSSCIITQGSDYGTFAQEICEVSGLGSKSGDDANAAFIVRAVNAHDELVAALLPFANAVDDGGNLKGGVQSSSYRADFIRARAVIAKAEARS